MAKFLLMFNDNNATGLLYTIVVTLKAATIQGSCVCHTQIVHVMVPKIGISKRSILTNLEKGPEELLQSEMFES
jgi:hypothetical protein